jgi:hypothetical protein
MRPTLLFALLPATGCIVYDHVPDDQKCDGCSSTEDTAGLEAPAVVFALDPDEGMAGEAVIASLTVSEGVFDLSTVSSIEAFGDLSIDATRNRRDEILLSLSVPPGAVEGEVDLLLHLQDGDATWFGAAFTVLPAEEEAGGGSATGGGPDTGDGGSDCP